MKNMVRTLMALKTLKVKKEVQNKTIPWLNLENDMEGPSPDAQEKIENDQNNEGEEPVQNILDAIRDKVERKTMEKMEKAKDAGVNEMQNIMTNFSCTLQAVLQTKKDSLNAQKMPKTELFLRNLNAAFQERKRGEPEVLKKLLQAEKKLEQKKKVEKE